jgi:hypothetical protein
MDVTVQREVPDFFNFDWKHPNRDIFFQFLDENLSLYISLDCMRSELDLNMMVDTFRFRCCSVPMVQLFSIIPLISRTRPQKWRFYFMLSLVRTTTKSIQFISKPVFSFWFFPCCCFGFICKAATTKNRQFIYHYTTHYKAHWKQETQR